MSEAVVVVIFDDLLRKLSQQGMELLGPQWGVEAQLQQIRCLFSSLQGELPEAESYYGRSFELQDWVKKLKDAAYDTEDLLEELSMEEPLRLRDGKLRRLFRLVDKYLFGWRMRRDLGAVTGRLRDLVGQESVTSIISGIPSEVRREVQEAREIPFVGRVDKKEELISILFDGYWHTFVVAVTGDNSGCGKTALVREVMTDLEVSEYFHVRIWVNVSPRLDENRMVKEIIASLREGTPDEEEEEEEGEVLGEQLLHLLARLLDDSKRYLFVLDDLTYQDLESKRWLRLRSLLEGGVASGSKLLVTISDYRNFWITPLGSSGIRSIHMESMDGEDALKLLRETVREAFTFDQIEADRIVDFCEGNLRMIKAVGGYLSLQPSHGDISRLIDRLFDNDREYAYSRLLYGGYPYGHLTSVGVKSYNNLPLRIKRSFSLCSLFPSGHPINPQTLAELWIALGFINNEGDEHDCRSLEDIAYHYLDVLLREELLRVKKSDIFGKVKWVTLHPDAQDFAPSLAGWECQAYDIYNPRLEYVHQNTRHLSIINYRGFLRYDHPPRQLRTFLHFEEDRDQLEEMYHYLITRLNHNQNRVRVLDLHDIMVHVLQEGVSKLKHLKYLNLSRNSTLDMLPPSTTGLLNLQTLKLSGCSSLKELPRDMNKLSALRHLYINGCWKLSRMPRGLGDLKCLNILTDFILPLDDSSETDDSSDLTDLCKLNNLRGSLKITNLGCYEDEIMDDKLEGLLDKKSLLECVELRFMNLQSDMSLLEKLRPHSNLKGLRIHNYGGTQFPVWMTQLSTHFPNLVEIALIGCENCLYLPLFGHLHHLKLLTFQGLPDLEYMESGSGQSLLEDTEDMQPFGNLSSLCIKDCPKLKSLPMTPRLMKLTLVNVSKELFRHPCQLPNLKNLHLENIELLDHLLEEWLRGLTSLKELHIGSCHSLVSLSPGIIRLENLETLSIWNCKELDLSKDEQGNMVMELQSLKSLKFLTIYKASKLEHLPEWLSHVATLKFLCIRSCPSLVVLPEWIGNFRSLKLLELIHCPRLESLPEFTRHFTRGYPKKLTVVGCPVLESRLRREEKTKHRHPASYRL